MKRPGDPCTLTRLWWEGPEPVAGDGLRTKTGRQYLILAVEGKRLECLVLERHEVINGAVYEWQWGKRSSRKT